MSGFLQSSIGKKLLMSLTGFFLIAFLVVHLVLNSLLLFDSTGELYNRAAHFMATNTVMHFMEPVLALGFIIHLIYAIILTLQNLRARPERYAVVEQSHSSKWASRNMFVLGSLIFIFIVLHMSHFFIKMKFGCMSDFVATHGADTMDNAYALVTQKFGIWWYNLIYIAGAVSLGLHLQHAFWSAFQTLGLSNNVWRTRLEVLGNIFTIVVAGGFAIIPLFFLIKSLI